MSYVSKWFRTFRKPIARRPLTVRITVHSVPSPNDLLAVIKAYKERNT